MAEFTIEETIVVPEPDLSQVVTEDNTPVHNLFSAKQQRLLVESLYTSWQPQRPFVADANVGIFSAVSQPAIVPDMFVSLDVEIAEDWFAKKHRSYFIWEFGKAPEVVVELGVTLWQGVFEAKEAQWLRWRDAAGNLLLTGAERAERLAAQLKALGIEPVA